MTSLFLSMKQDGYVKRTLPGLEKLIFLLPYYHLVRNYTVNGVYIIIT